MIISTVSVAHGQASYLDLTNVNNGKVAITYKSDKTLAAVVVKGNQKEQYILKGNNNSIPLQLGDGQYTIQVAEQVSGTSYKQISKETVNVKLENPNLVYLQSTQEVNFSSDMAAVKKASELTKNAKNDKEKVQAIYNYIVKNIKYDYNKAATVAGTYIPTLDNTLSTNTGICYDYSSLFAGMLRSQNIPTKLVKGNSTNIKDYHAWNEVLLDGQWHIVDTTYDAGILQGNVKVNMFKQAAEYTATGVY